MDSLAIFWFRRDLRLQDNAGLYHALKSKGLPVQPIFIFDPEILGKLSNPEDARVTFIYDTIAALKRELQEKGSDLWVFFDKPSEVFKKLAKKSQIQKIYLNNDYEPYARKRDEEVLSWSEKNGIEFHSFKDQCLFEKSEILSGANKPYTVYTPYKKKVLATLNSFYLKSYPTEKYFKSLNPILKPQALLTLKELGFQRSSIEIPSSKISLTMLKNYSTQRDFPASPTGTSRIGIHLRFGTVSVRELARLALKHSGIWLSELIWRDFFMQILWHFPHVEKKSFRPEYDRIQWRKSKSDFEKWKNGMTGYPIVDAGMRELKETGHMHNRVRMVTASFLCKHLLIYWYEGERYFASQLLDFDLSANNGNWQWAAGTGCDAAPYFRVFNPMTQAKKFDSKDAYIKKWIPEYGTENYPDPMIDHAEARGRCLQTYALGLKGKK